LVKSLRNVDLSEYLREWLAAGPKTKGNLKLEIDVDPQSFFVKAVRHSGARQRVRAKSGPMTGSARARNP